MQLITPALTRLTAHCQRGDRAFWPQGLCHRHMSVGPEAAQDMACSSAEPAGKDAFEQLGFSRGYAYLWTQVLLRHVMTVLEAVMPGCACTGG